MKSFIVFATLCAFSALPTFAQPTIASIVSSATYLPAGLPNSAIAQGSIFIIFGSNMGPVTLTQVEAYPVPKELAGTSVTVSVGGTSTSALMIYTLAGQVSAILPSSTPVGVGTVTVTYNGQTSGTLPVTVVSSNFGMYTLSQNGSGPAVVTSGTNEVITLTSTAKPGDTVVLYGTGLGPYSGDETNPPVESGLNVNAAVYVGDLAAAVVYEGRSSSPGLDQINFTIPAGVSGCYVPIAVVVNGLVSNFGSLSVSADGSTCSNPIGLPSSAINQAASTGSLKVGYIELQKVGFSAAILGGLETVNVKEDEGNAYFYNFNDQSLLYSHGLSSISAFSACTVQVCNNADTCIPDTTALKASQLSAGSQITITGSSGKAVLPVSAGKLGEYHGLLGTSSVVLNGTDYLQPGAYTASNGTGGSDVGAFTADLTVSSPVTWSNQATISAQNSIDRTKDLNIAYSGGASGDYVAILGTSTSATGNVTATFICTEKASAGTFTVPSFVLSALPASGTITVDGVNGAGGFLLLGNLPASNTFTAPGIDLGLFTAIAVNGINIPFK